MGVFVTTVGAYQRWSSSFLVINTSSPALLIHAGSTPCTASSLFLVLSTSWLLQKGNASCGGTNGIQPPQVGLYCPWSLLGSSRSGSTLLMREVLVPLDIG